MAHIHLPTGPSVQKPAFSPAHGPGDTHARPGPPKTTRPQPACTPSVPKPALSPAQGSGDAHVRPTASKTTRSQHACTQPDLPGHQRTLCPNNTSQGGKRTPEPGLPWISHPTVGDEVYARQASFSRTWHSAVVTATRTSGRHISCDVRWDDGSHTRALPLSRVRRLSSDAPPHTVDSPGPGYHSPSSSPLSGAAAPPGD